MRYLQIDDYGKYLIIRKASTDSGKFFSALHCKKTEGPSLQNALCNLFCAEGENVESIFKAYLHDFPLSKLKLAEFIARYFSICIEDVQLFLREKKDDDLLLYVDNVIINGYSETFILNDDGLDEIVVQKFQKSFKEAIKHL